MGCRGVVAIAGPSSSGKSTLASFIQLEAGARGIPTLRLSLADCLRRVLCVFAPEYEPVLMCKDQAAKAVRVGEHTVREHLIGLDPYVRAYHPSFVESVALEAIRNFFDHLCGQALVIVDDVRRLREVQYLARTTEVWNYQPDADRFVAVLTAAETEDPIFEEEVYDWEPSVSDWKRGRAFDMNVGNLVGEGLEESRRVAGLVLDVVFQREEEF